MYFDVLADHRVKRKLESEKYLDLVRDQRKKNNNKNKNKKPNQTKQNKRQTVECEGDSDINCNWCTWNVPQMLEKRQEEQEIGGRNEVIWTTALLR